MNLQEQVIWSIKEERARQDKKWGSQCHLSPYTWMTTLMEEVCKAARLSLEGDSVGYSDELVQVAAVAIAALESHYAQEPAIVEDESPDASHPVEGGEMAIKYLEKSACSSAGHLPDSCAMCLLLDDDVVS
ncbi:hypothetical protein LCGC14_2093610 [marine sediment metagenome]|uniref:Uncharacterized protein n=2 Tax=marine sediment metagenome TaxID=412755 RepID=A0A0F9GQ23_9ZZZZ